MRGHVLKPGEFTTRQTDVAATWGSMDVGLEPSRVQGFFSRDPLSFPCPWLCWGSSPREIPAQRRSSEMSEYQ